MASQRITVSLPSGLLKGIDKRSKNRSEFMQRAVRHEFERELTEKLNQSLNSPHPKSISLEEEGVVEWLESLPDEATGLGDPPVGAGIRWAQDTGWEKLEP